MRCVKLQKEIFHLDIYSELNSTDEVNHDKCNTKKNFYYNLVKTCRTSKYHLHLNGI